MDLALSRLLPVRYSIFRFYFVSLIIRFHIKLDNFVRKNNTFRLYCNSHRRRLKMRFEK